MTPCGVIGSLQNSGIRFTENNAEGVPEVVFRSGIQNGPLKRIIFSAMPEELFSCTYSENLDVSPYLHKWDYGIGGMFGGGKVMIITCRLGASELMTNMEADYGIVPAPKYDAEQSRFYTAPDPNFTLLTVPITNQRMDFTSCVLEYMAVCVDGYSHQRFLQQGDEGPARTRSRYHRNAGYCERYHDL